MLLRLERVNKILLSPRRSFFIAAMDLARKPPKEEQMNNIYQTRKRTSEPFDRRWKWTPKSAEPYNVRGGDIKWTLLPFLHRGVQFPGYMDPKTKKFVYVEEMVPEIIVPDLNGFELKPYISYDADDVKREPLDAKTLYKKTLEKDVLRELENKAEKL